jgi:hypothetical protein
MSSRPVRRPVGGVPDSLVQRALVDLSAPGERHDSHDPDAISRPCRPGCRGRPELGRVEGLPRLKLDRAHHPELVQGGQAGVLVGGQNETVAPPNSHAIAFYNSLSGPKSYLDLAGADHFFPTKDNPAVSQGIVSWFKRFVSSDNRFMPFTCVFAGGVANFRGNAC